MLRFCSVFIAFLFFAASAWAQPVVTGTIQDTENILPFMTWLPDPGRSISYDAASGPEMQKEYEPLTKGFPLTSTGSGWLRLELVKNEQHTASPAARVEKKPLYLNLSFLPQGTASLYKTGAFPPKGDTAYQPLMTRVNPFQTERLAEPSISNAVYYIHLEETPGLWFNPTLSRTDTKSPILPHDLLLPSILLACLAFCLLRLAMNRAIWPVWAAGILVCVIAELLLPLPVSGKPLGYADLPALLAPGISIMMYAQLGRLLLYSPQTYPGGDNFLRYYPIAGAVLALAPFVPGFFWITRLFPLWGLLLIPLLFVAANALIRQLKGSFAYFVATIMPVLGSSIALYAVFNPTTNSFAESATFWGVAIGSIVLIFARAAKPEPKQEAGQSSGETEDAPLGLFAGPGESAPISLPLAQNPVPADQPDVPGKGPLSDPLKLPNEPDDIFSRLQYVDLSGMTATRTVDPQTPSLGPSLVIAPIENTQSKDLPAKDDGGELAPDHATGLARGQTTSATDAQKADEAETLADNQVGTLAASQTADLPANNQEADSAANLASQSAAQPDQNLLDMGEMAIVPHELGLEKTLLTGAGTDKEEKTPPRPSSLNISGIDDTIAEEGPSAVSVSEPAPQHESEKAIIELRDLAQPETEQAPGTLNLLDWPDPETASTPTGTTSLSSPSSPSSLSGTELTTEDDGISTYTKKSLDITATDTSTTAQNDDTLTDRQPEDTGLLINLTSTSAQEAGQTPATAALPVEEKATPLMPDEPPAVIVLTDERTENTIPPGAAQKVDEVLASLELVETETLMTQSAEIIELDDTDPSTLGQHNESDKDSPYVTPDDSILSGAGEESRAPVSDQAHSRVQSDADAKAYIEALLTPADKQSPPAHLLAETFRTEAVHPVARAIDFSLTGDHGAEEDALLAEHGDHCIIITEMTTSNKRLLQSYFNETGIPCIETSGADDVAATQEKTGSPLIIYDADSPEDTIIASIQRVNAIAKNKPAHLVLSSVEAQTNRLLELGATLALAKPFTKADLFAIAREAAPALFGEDAAAAGEKNAESPAVLSSSVPQASPQEDGTETSENRIDDLLAQLNAPAKTDKTPLHMTAEEQTESVISKMLATDNGASPSDSGLPVESGNSTSAPDTPEETQPDTSLAHDNTDVTVIDTPETSSSPAEPEMTDSLNAPEPSDFQKVSGFTLGSATSDSPDSQRNSSTDLASDFDVNNTGKPETNSQYSINEEQQAHQPLTAEMPQPPTAEEAPVSQKMPLAETPGMGTGTKTSSASLSNAKNTEPLLDFIVDDEATMTSDTTKQPANMSLDQSFADTEQTPADHPPATALADAAPAAEDEKNGLQPLPGLEDEFIEKLMLPLIPGLLYTLKDGIHNAETALAGKDLLAIHESASNIASKAETFGLMKLDKIAQCVVRATNADDVEATAALLEDLGSVTKRYIKSLEACYNEYIESARPLE